MPRRRSLFSIDPGWPWVAAGLLFIAAAVVVPAQRLLEQDRAELRRLQGVEARIYRLLEAHDRFLSDLREGEESLLLRLAASNLNRMPQDRSALVISDSIDRHPIEWIDAAVPAAETGSPPRSASLLERALAGKGRLWVTAVGVLCLFTGLLLGPGWSPKRREAAPDGDGSPLAAAGGVAAAGLEASSGDADERERWRPSPAAWRRARRLEVEVPTKPAAIAEAAVDASEESSAAAGWEADAALAEETDPQQDTPPQEDATLWGEESRGDLEESPEIAALAAASDPELDRASEQRPIRVSAEELAMLLEPADAADSAEDPAGSAARHSPEEPPEARIEAAAGDPDGQCSSDRPRSAPEQDALAQDAAEEVTAEEDAADEAAAPEPARTLHGSGASAV